jgi:hypothetical protein
LVVALAKILSAFGCIFIGGKMKDGFKRPFSANLSQKADNLGIDQLIKLECRVLLNKGGDFESIGLIDILDSWNLPA